MFFNSFKAIFSAIKQLFKSWQTMLLLATTYGGFLAAAYLFVSTREATVSQLVLSLVLVFVAPTLFFLLQAASVNFATGPVVRGLLRKSVRDCWKLVVVSLPVVALICLALYGLGKLQAHFLAGSSIQTVAQLSQPHKGLTLITAARYLLVGVAGPLMLIQSWIAVTNLGLRFSARRVGEVLCRAFAPESVLIYASGPLVFAAIPYLMLSKTVSSERAWVEIAALGVRLLASGVLILLGWVTTLGALSLISATSTEKQEV